MRRRIGTLESIRPSRGTNNGKSIIAITPPVSCFGVIKLGPYDPRVVSICVERVPETSSSRLLGTYLNSVQPDERELKLASYITRFDPIFILSKWLSNHSLARSDSDNCSKIPSI